MKKVIKKELQFIGRRAFSASIFAVVFVAVAGTSLWALAAFTEPTTGPAASIQDFATNIMGANNADNVFDSSAVTANADGSVLERLEDLGDTDYVTCVNAYSHPYSSTTACPSGWSNIKSGNWVSAWGDQGLKYTYWYICCLPR